MRLACDATGYPAWIHDDSPIADPLGHGERAVKFLRALRHPKAPDGLFRLDRWQERIVRAIYGPRHDDGSRIVKTVVLLLPRGNRKTTLGAALSLLHTVGPERLPGGEVLTAASDRKQARLAFQEAVNVIAATPAIERVTTIQDYRNRITSTRHRSFFESISSDAGTQHGRTPAFALVDELHAWKKRDLWDVVKSGLVKVAGSLLIVATTAGRGQENIAHDIIDDARKVARGEVEDSSILPILFETPADADWRDEALWFRANPGLSCDPPYPDLEGLRQLAKEGERRPGDREAFRQLNLNVWLDKSHDPFVDMDVYDMGRNLFDVAELEGREAWIGLDASSTTDLTAVVAVVRGDDDELFVLPSFFCPGNALRRRGEVDGVPYPRWADEGHLTLTPGDVIDYPAVENCIRDLCSRFNVVEIAADPAYSRQVTIPLANDGFPVIEFRQGWRSMGPAIADLERAIVGGKFHHGGHPLLRWCFENVAVQTDSSGNRSFHKGRSRDRIDGAVAAAMAVSRALSGEMKPRSIFENDWPLEDFLV
ncbi:terminase large subunit [Pseudochelatococcus lubricantis]|uniref:terminase large subunit n=1 Tax=Pseudochelatococcus lubricantis TaxID=1538102 RepID=UPI0035E5B0D8